LKIKKNFLSTSVALVFRMALGIWDETDNFW
jgi:hypothetical protein